MKKEEFIFKLKTLKNAVSIKEVASYSAFQIKDSKLLFKRDNKNTYWEIDIDELYNAFCKLDFINTVNIRDYVSGRVYSPACAVLIAMGLYDGNGIKIYLPKSN